MGVSFRRSYRSSSEKAMAPHSSTLAWKIPGMEEPGRLQPMGSLRVDTTERLHFHTQLSDFTFTFMHWRRKWQPTPVFLPGESQGRGAWWAAICGVAQSRTRLKRLSSSSSSIGLHRTVQLQLLQHYWLRNKWTWITVIMNGLPWR